MTLQSQAPRATFGRSSSRGSGGGSPISARNLVAAGAVLGVVVLVAVLWSRMGISGDAPNAPDLTSSTNTPTLGSGSTVASLAPTNAVTNPGAQTPATNTPATNPTTNPAANPAKPAIPPAAAPGSNPGASPNAANPGVTPPPGPGDQLRITLEAANKAMAAGNLVDARTTLNKALLDATTSAKDRADIRQQMAFINETLVFGPVPASGDPFADAYSVKSGDVLTKIVREQSLPVDWRFLQRINKMQSPSALRIGQRLKVVRIPFHAVVHKNDFRMDIYMGPPASGSPATTGPDGQDTSWTYIRSFKVGLGESNGTPEGSFIVRPASKLIDPRWVNPRTSQVFEKNDPKNPIGEHWLGLDGVDDNTRRFTGYGIHGTIEPDSVGKQMSMGCVRMLPEDIAIVYEMLAEKISTVRIIK